MSVFPPFGKIPNDLVLSSLTSQKIVTGSISSQKIVTDQLSYRDLTPPITAVTSIAGEGEFQLSQSGSVFIEDSLPKTIKLPKATTSRNYLFNIGINGVVLPSVLDGLVHRNSIVQDDTFLYVGGSFTSLGQTSIRALARIFLTTGEVDTEWDPGLNGTVNQLAIDTDGGFIYAAGDFTLANGNVTRNRIARFPLTAPATVDSWDPNLNSGAEGLALDIANNRIYVGGSFTTVNGGATARNRLARFPLTIPATVDSWNPNVNNVPRVIVIDNGSDRVYIGGDFTNAGGAARNFIARISTVTGLADAWDPNLNARVRSISIDFASGLVYLGGDFVTVNGGTIARNFIARFPDTTPAVPDTWDLSLNGVVEQFAPDFSQNRVYIVGTFISPKVRLARVGTATPAIVDNWGPAIGSQPFSILLSDDVVYVGGSYTTVGTLQVNRLVSIFTDGPVLIETQNTSETLNGKSTSFRFYHTQGRLILESMTNDRWASMYLPVLN